MRAEDLRLVALVLLGAAAVAIAGGFVAWILGAPNVWLIVVAATTAFCIAMAIALIVRARLLERRLMDRIDQ